MICTDACILELVGLVGENMLPQKVNVCQLDGRRSCICVSIDDLCALSGQFLYKAA